jgi:hypothetical protein
MGAPRKKNRAPSSINCDGGCLAVEAFHPGFLCCLSYNEWCSAVDCCKDWGEQWTALFGWSNLKKVVLALFVALWAQLPVVSDTLVEDFNHVRKVRRGN